MSVDNEGYFGDEFMPVNDGYYLTDDGYLEDEFVKFTLLHGFS